LGAHANGHGHADESQHMHGNEPSHQHSDATPKDRGDQSSSCCGLMCTPALPASFVDSVCDLPSSTAVALWLELRFIGSGPGLLYRPPIS
jgi:hypothetical protein